jgi:predicted porin
MEMMKRYEPVKAVVAAAALSAAIPAFAQSSVTLYGVVDNGIGYQNNAATLGSTTGGHSATKMTSGVWLGDRFGLKGSEDLGGGTKAIFQLEEGFSGATGAMSVSNTMFSRTALVGMTNPAFGTLTAGRQYASYYQFLTPYSPTTWLTGFYGAHPGDVDGLDSIYRANNTLVYTSPTMYGFSASGSYSLGGVAGSFNAGSTWSVALQYVNGPLGAAAAFSRINNSTPGGGAFGAASTTSNAGAEIGVSAVTNGYQTARAQQRVGVGALYKFSPSWDVSATYTNVQYIAGSGSLFHDTAIFNTGGVVLHWEPSTHWDFAGGYSYTRATKSNGISSNAQYQQFNLSQYYSLSKRTGIYVLEAYQHATGQTLAPNSAGNGVVAIDATATIGDGFQTSPSSGRNMFAAGAGIVHRF